MCVCVCVCVWERERGRERNERERKRQIYKELEKEKDKGYIRLDNCWVGVFVNECVREREKCGYKIITKDECEIQIYR